MFPLYKLPLADILWQMLPSSGVRSVTYLRHCCLGSRASLWWPDRTWYPSRPWQCQGCCQSERNLYPWTLGSRSCSSPLPSEYSLCNYLKIKFSSFFSRILKEKLFRSWTLESWYWHYWDTVIPIKCTNYAMLYGSNFSDLHFTTWNPLFTMYLRGAGGYSYLQSWSSAGCPWHPWGTACTPGQLSAASPWRRGSVWSACSSIWTVTWSIRWSKCLTCWLLRLALLYWFERQE